MNRAFLSRSVVFAIHLARPFSSSWFIKSKEKLYAGTLMAMIYHYSQSILLFYVSMNINDRLWKYCSDPNREFALFHNHEDLDYPADEYGFDGVPASHIHDGGEDDAYDVLRKFLFATVDEARFFYAELYAEIVLQSLRVLGKGFRQFVLRRELLDDVLYDKHRDHAAHTVYNYLLGWYIYSNSRHVQLAFRKNLESRVRLPRPKADKDLYTRWSAEDIYCVQSFGYVWPYATLLHDIGYMFEGGIRSTATESDDEQIELAAKHVSNHFDHQFWRDNGLASADSRGRVRCMLGNADPQFLFENTTLDGIADSLRNLGVLDLIGAKYKQEVKDAGNFRPVELFYFPNDLEPIWTTLRCI